MRITVPLILLVALLGWAASAAQPRFVIDDEEYTAKVIEAGTRLVQKGGLPSLERLRAQFKPGHYPVTLAPVQNHKISAPDLCDRLMESVVTVGALYKCVECGEWHFNSSAGFSVGPGGIISTCCHVVYGEAADVGEGYLVIADAAARIYPARAILAADPESDTCLVQVDAPALKPLPLRAGARPGERIYCLSHPGGYYFMFTEGLIARVCRKPNDLWDAFGQTNSTPTRPILFLNVTTEFAPGSSGAPVVDESGNVVAQVASITDVGEFEIGSTNAPPSPSVPVRFCTAAEELLRITGPESPQQNSSKK